MMSLPRLGGKLVWRDLLSPEEIRAWVVDGKKPVQLSSNELAYPGVYRFIFPEQVDGSARHTPFYVGEGGNVGKRLGQHFAPSSSKEKRDAKGILTLKSGWQVRGSIQNSRGECALQILSIEGSVNVGGVILSQHSFDCPFGRKLLENWAIIYSQRLDKLRQLNRGVSQSGKVLIREIHKKQELSRKRTKIQEGKRTKVG